MAIHYQVLLVIPCLCLCKVVRKRFWRSIGKRSIRPIASRWPSSVFLRIVALARFLCAIALLENSLIECIRNIVGKMVFLQKNHFTHNISYAFYFKTSFAYDPLKGQKLV